MKGFRLATGRINELANFLAQEFWLLDDEATDPLRFLRLCTDKNLPVLKDIPPEDRTLMDYLKARQTEMIRLRAIVEASQ